MKSDRHVAAQSATASTALPTCLVVSLGQSVQEEVGALWASEFAPSYTLKQWTQGLTQMPSFKLLDGDAAPAVVVLVASTPPAAHAVAARQHYPEAMLIAVAAPGGPAFASAPLVVDHVMTWAACAGGGLRDVIALLTRLAAAERAHEEHSARVWDWTQATSDWFWELGPDLSFTHVSGRLAESTGVDARLLIGDKVEPSSLPPPRGGSKPRAFEPFKDLIYPIEDRTGRRHWLKVNGAPRFDKDGEFLGYRGTSVDITEEVEACERAEAAYALLEDVFEALPLSLVLFDEDERLALYNQAYVAQWGDDHSILKPGVKAEALLREQISRGLITEAFDDEEAWLEARLTRLRAPPGSIEERVTSDGRIWEVVERLTRDGHRLSIGNDVTESRHRQAAQRESEACFRAIFERNLHGVLVLDAAGEVRDANPAALRLFEVQSQEDVVGHALSDFVKGHYRSTLRQANSRVAAGEAQVHAFEIHTFSGRRRWIEMGSTPLSMNTGEEGSSQLCVLRDITDVRADQARMSRTLRILDESTNEVYLFGARRRHFQQVNRRGRANLGYSLHELLDMTPADVTPEITDLNWAALLRPMLDGKFEERRLEMVFQRKDGSRYPVEAYIRLSREGTPVFVAIVLDVSERKRAEEDLLQAQKLEAVGQLAGGVAHDFNNVLTVIGGNLRLLARELAVSERAEDWTELVGDALSATQRAGDLTRSLLSIARKDSVDLSQVDVTDVVVEVGKLLRRTLPASIKVMTITTDPRQLAYSNRTFLHTAMLNLGLNARDAMPDGGELTLAVEAARIMGAKASALAVQPGQYVRVIARDTGMGMPAEVLERIFEPLFSTKPAGKGTGLGLTMVHGFVRDCGGAIQVNSRVGEGTEIIIHLPVFMLESPTVEDKSGAVGRSYEVSGTVLVVEDDALLRSMVVRGLTKLGCTALEAHSAEAAVRVLEIRQGIDVVLTDMQMDGAMDGLDLERHLRQTAPAIAVILMSGDDNALVRAHREGDAHTTVLRKPFTVEELVATLPASLVKRR